MNDEEKIELKKKFEEEYENWYNNKESGNDITDFTTNYEIGETAWVAARFFSMSIV